MFQVIWLARTPKRLFAANDNRFKRDKKHLMLKHKALEVHSLIVQQNIDVHNIKYTQLRLIKY